MEGALVIEISDQDGRKFLLDSPRAEDYFSSAIGGWARRRISCLCWPFDFIAKIPTRTLRVKPAAALVKAIEIGRKRYCAQKRAD